MTPFTILNTMPFWMLKGQQISCPFCLFFVIRFFPRQPNPLKFPMLLFLWFHFKRHGPGIQFQPTLT